MPRTRRDTDRSYTAKIRGRLYDVEPSSVIGRLATHTWALPAAILTTVLAWLTVLTALAAVKDPAAPARGIRETYAESFAQMAERGPVMPEADTLALTLVLHASVLTAVLSLIVAVALCFKRTREGAWLNEPRLLPTGAAANPVPLTRIVHPSTSAILIAYGLILAACVVFAAANPGAGPDVSAAVLALTVPLSAVSILVLLVLMFLYPFLVLAVCAALVFKLGDAGGRLLIRALDHLQTRLERAEA